MESRPGQRARRGAGASRSTEIFSYTLDAHRWHGTALRCAARGREIDSRLADLAQNPDRKWIDTTRFRRGRTRGSPVSGDDRARVLARSTNKNSTTLNYIENYRLDYRIPTTNWAPPIEETNVY